MITGVGRAWHDRVGSRSNRVLAWRTTLDCVVPSEGLISVASISSDRSSPYARRHAASESEMHREVDSRVSVLQGMSGHTAASIAGQGQIAVID
jgi:hypothetical protein